MSNLSESPIISAEDRALKRNATDRVQRYVPTGRSLDKLLVPALLASLEFLPESGAVNLARGILIIDNNMKLYEHFDYIYQLLFLPKQAEKVAPQISSPAEREQETRENTLKRDGRRCVITKRILRKDWKDAGKPSGETPANLQVAHIIPFIYGSYKDRNPSDKYATRRWTCLYHCFPGLHRKIHDEKINDPSNTITLASYIHEEFGEFNIALRPTRFPNEYELKVYDGFDNVFSPLLPKDGLLQLSVSPGNEDIKLPDPNFLDTHYRLAEIFHASRIDEEIDRHIQDFKDLTCLAEDGSTNINQLLTI
ncbi:hypothetical protein DTO027B5_5343 [Paecilomyces variotii]|nr:hypothetical protein DTO027B3_7040 [Paecilomyces variotii]KAJ9332916.1 hypothetical protein DTO027B5_5343 [Paecilomyces variotii]